METISYKRLTKDNFCENSLDNFIRYQEVKECWRKIAGKYRLVPHAFVEHWDQEECREQARLILQETAHSGVAYGAFCDSEVIGFCMLSGGLFGSNSQYMDLHLLYVSEPFRNRGIGRTLFRLACDAAREAGAKKLYISAHSSRESQAAYRSFGCIEAVEINQRLAENEPFDVQMEYVI